MKIEGVYNIKGRGAALACTPDGAPRMGSIIRSHASGKAWLINGVERFCVPWAPGMRCGLLLQAREDGAMPVEGEEVEMVEPLTLAARVAAMEAHVATLDALKAIGDRQEALAARCEVLEAALGEALDGWDRSHFPAPVRRADAETIKRLRALAAGTAAPPSPLLCPFCGEPLTPPDHCVHDGEQVNVDCPACGEEVAICPTVEIAWEVPKGWNRRAAGTAAAAGEEPAR